MSSGCMNWKLSGTPDSMGIRGCAVMVSSPQVLMQNSTHRHEDAEKEDFHHFSLRRCVGLIRYSALALRRSTSSSSSLSSFMNGTTMVPSRSPILSVRLPPTRTVTPRSLPGDRALVMTLMQCMHLTQLRLSIASVSSALSFRQLVGQRVMTLSIPYWRPLSFTNVLTSF